MPTCHFNAALEILARIIRQKKEGKLKKDIQIGKEVKSHLFCRWYDLMCRICKHAIEKLLEISELSKVVGYKTNTKISCILQNNSQRRSWTQVSQ